MMTNQKLPLTSAMMRKFTQQMYDFRGEVEMLDMKMTDLMYFWLDVVDTYDEEKKALKFRNEQKVVSNEKSCN